MGRRVVGVLAALAVLALMAAPVALAYDGEVEVQVGVNGPGRAVCPTAITATVTVVDRDGKPLEGVAVVWSNGESGVTDANGMHTTSVDVSESLTVEATASGATGTLVIECVQGGVLGAVGLPRTDTVPERTTTDGTLAAGSALVAAALVCLAIAIRRRSVEPR